jgi:4-hydroxy-tetrahydrodipicolinate reductase
MEKKIQVLLVGFGKVAQVILKYLQNDPKIKVLPFVLAKLDDNDGLQWSNARKNNLSIIYPLDNKHLKSILTHTKEDEGPFIAIDFTAPAAVIPNAVSYIQTETPFLMGTTGGDRQFLKEMVREANIPAVIAPNMVSQIVMLGDMLKWAGQIYDKPLAGWTLQVIESHQASKKDPSGTGTAYAKLFQKLGAEIDITDPADFVVIRDREGSMEMGVPEEHLNGHGFHTYILRDPTGAVSINFEHNVLGREAYGPNVVKCVHFLHQKVANNESGFFEVSDVIRR